MPVTIVVDEWYDQRSVGFGIAERLRAILTELENLEAEAEENELPAIGYRLVEVRGRMGPAIRAGEQYADGTLDPQ
jgi:hypothetical protein